MSNLHNILLVDSAPFTGGAQESFWSLASALPSSRYAVHLLSADMSPAGLVERARDLQIPCTPFQARHWPASPAGLRQFLVDRKHFQTVLQSILSGSTFHLVHANGIRSLLLLPRLDIPVILHDRDVKMPFFIPCLATRRFPRMHVVAISPKVAQKWRHCLPDEQISIVPNGFDIQSINRHSLPATPHESLHLVQVADFSPWKRHDLFIATLAKLRPLCPGLKATIKGRVRDAASKRLLEKLTRQACSLQLGDILQINSLDESALPYIAAADVLVSCAEDEPFGRTMIEALALGKPVVSCGGSGLDDMLHDCPAASVTTPGKLVYTLLEWNSHIRRLNAADAARQFAQRFSIANHVSAIIGIYKKQIIL